MKRTGTEGQSAVDTFGVLVVVLIIITGVVGVLLYTHMTIEPHESPGFLTVEDGNQIQFAYTGYYENTLVFETTVEDIAVDNETYPKSLLYEWPEPEITPIMPEGIFGPIFMKIGDGIPHSKFEGMSGHGVILEQAMIGMQVNQTKNVWVTPEDGFGEHDPSKVVTLDLEETRDKREVIMARDFFERFGSAPVVNATYTDPRWGWDVRVVSSRQVGQDSELTLDNSPWEGMNISAYVGFQSRVVKIESGANGGIGEIVIRHLLDPVDANKVMGDSPHGDGRFVVVSVNEAAGTFEADFNSEKAGETLRYEITILSIGEG
jgi:FKBP-type peptidyl-prolyl cis-trans isomerase 2